MGSGGQDGLRCFAKSLKSQVDPTFCCFFALILFAQLCVDPLTGSSKNGTCVKQNETHSWAVTMLMTDGVMRETGVSWNILMTHVTLFLLAIVFCIISVPFGFAFLSSVDKSSRPKLFQWIILNIFISGVMILYGTWCLLVLGQMRILGVAMGIFLMSDFILAADAWLLSKLNAIERRSLLIRYLPTVCATFALEDDELDSNQLHGTIERKQNLPQIPE